VPVPLRGVLNGGRECESFPRPRFGEGIPCRGAYRDITRRERRSGPMGPIVVGDESATAGGSRPLPRSVSTLITR
jgi:hypothetical protein